MEKIRKDLSIWFSGNHDIGPAPSPDMSTTSETTDIYIFLFWIVELLKQQTKQARGLKKSTLLIQNGTIISLH